MNNAKIIPFDSIKKVKENKYASYSNSKKHKNNMNRNDSINEKITEFFFNAIHKNYLLNRKK